MSDVEILPATPRALSLLELRLRGVYEDVLGLLDDKPNGELFIVRLKGCAEALDRLILFLDEHSEEEAALDS